MHPVRAAALCLLEEKRKEWDLECSTSRGFVSVSSGVLFPSNFLWFSVHPSLSITLIWLNGALLTSPHNFSLCSFFCWQFLVVTVDAFPYVFNLWYEWGCRKPERSVNSAYPLNFCIRNTHGQFKKSVHMSLLHSYVFGYTIFFV